MFSTHIIRGQSGAMYCPNEWKASTCQKVLEFVKVMEYAKDILTKCKIDWNYICSLYLDFLQRYICFFTMHIPIVYK